LATVKYNKGKARGRSFCFPPCFLYHDLPESESGAAIVRLALSRLGDPYSQLKAGQGNYTDCSYLAHLCVAQVGISIPRTAAAQGKYCVDNGLTISHNDLVPGDLVFFSHDANGQFMDTTHVAIYAGDGYIVNDSSSKGQVLYGKPRIE
jgi:cell wall-associated NlpC family hydrolase